MLLCTLSRPPSTLADSSTSTRSLQARHRSSVPDYSSGPLHRASSDVFVHVSRRKSTSEMPSPDADPLNASTPAGYGTLPYLFTQNGGRKVFRGRRGLPPLSSIVTGQNIPGSTVSSPGGRRSWLPLLSVPQSNQLRPLMAC